MANTKTIDTVAFGTCYVDTNVSSFPFESTGIPTETELIGAGYETVPGGSAVNFSLMLSKLGMKAAFIGMVGTDPNGDLLDQLLSKAGVTAELIRQPALLTNIGFNLTNPSGEHIMLVAGTANAALRPELVLPKLEEVLPRAKILYLGGCFKLHAFEAAFADIPGLGRRHGADLVIDHNRIPAGTSPSMLAAVKQLVRGATYYLPARDEFCRLWEVGTIEAGLRQLAKLAPSLTVAVTDGEHGAYYWADGAMQHVPTPKVDQVVNATGAGDTFNAGFIKAIVAGQDVPDAIKAGCELAARKVSGNL